MTSQLRLLTWNVRGLLGDPFAVRRVIRSAAADLVCLQEAPQFVGSRWRLASLARDCGLLLIGGGRASAGTAVLADLRTYVTDVSAFRLPVPGLRAPRRGAVVATAGLPGSVRFRLGCLHLPLDAALRAQHLDLLRPHVTPMVGGPMAGGPVADGSGRQRVVLCGDLNEPAGGPSWTALADLAGDPAAGAGPTFPVRGLRNRIDAVLVGGLTVVEYDAWRADPADLAAASDHRPVVAVLDLPGS